MLVADLTTIIGTFGLIGQLSGTSWTVASLERYCVVLGIGCILAWIGLLRYLKINYKFNLLFSTLYHSIWDVLAYLACIAILFIGYLSFGYIVIGPYHIKFETPRAAGATLFALINGDEIYATFALLREDYTGGDPLLPLVYRIYIGSYIAIFTIIVINLLIALFTNGYDSVKQQYENPEDPEESPMERALKQMLATEDDSQNKQLKGSFINFIKGKDSQRFSFMENKLRTELRKTMRITEKNLIVLKKPRTLKAFILDEEREEIKPTHCCCVISCLRFWGSKDQCYF